MTAFDVTAVPRLLSKLREGDSVAAELSSGTWPARLDTLMMQADSMVNHSVALALAVSDSAGMFRLDIPVTDSVLIYALNHDEDEPTNQLYMIVSGRVSKSFILDVAGGGCGPVNEH